MNEEAKCPIRTRAAKWLKKMRQSLVLYFDDLLLLAGGICFVLAACMAFGAAAALAVAGVWLSLFSWLIARSRKGGGSL